MAERTLLKPEPRREAELEDWDRVHDTSLADADRAESILHLAEAGDPKVPPYLTGELRRTDLSPGWRDALVLAAEAVEVVDVEARAALAETLLTHARNLNRSDDAMSVPALWSALRRYVSLAGADGLDALIDFLSSDIKGVRQVVLQGIQNAFALAPPSKFYIGRLRPLSERVAELTSKYLDRDWLISPHNAALAMNAFHAAAILGDVRVGSYSRTLKATAKNWFVGRVRRALEETRAAWARYPIEPGTDTAIIRRLDEAIAELRDPGS